MRKQTTCLLAAGMVLAAALILTGCPKEASKAEPDSRLIATWKNGDKTALSGLYKEFTIGEDYTFTAYINPAFIEAVAAARENPAVKDLPDPQAAQATREGLKASIPGLTGTALEAAVDALIASWEWKVTGTLTIDDGEIYLMDNLEEKNARDVDPNDPTKGKANTAVGGYNKEKVEIKFSSDTSFTFRSAGDNAKVTEYFGGTYTKVAE
jgi:hypothetical protein